MMQDAVKHGGGQHRVACEGLIPTAERQVRGQDHRAFLVAFCRDLEEEVCLFPSERQVSDLVDDQAL